MSSTPTPRQILETLLPQLKVAAAYSRQIQGAIATLPAKQENNIFSAALSDADLSIQNFVEVALLGSFPQILFYGEEYESSRNTKYFRGTTLGDQDDYLVTLDPIDGTRFYLDGHPNYQIIVGILNRDEFEAAIALTPAQNTYYYALRGEGAFTGTLEDSLAACSRLQVKNPKEAVYLGLGMGAIAPALKEHYEIFDVGSDYSADVQIPNFNGILSGELAGAAIKAAQFIDGAALAFIAKEAGCIVTAFDGSPLLPLHECENYRQPGLVAATSETVHQHLVEAVKSL